MVQLTTVVSRLRRRGSRWQARRPTGTGVCGSIGIWSVGDLILWYDGGVVGASRRAVAAMVKNLEKESHTEPTAPTCSVVTSARISGQPPLHKRCLSPTPNFYPVFCRSPINDSVQNPSTRCPNIMALMILPGKRSPFLLSVGCLDDNSSENVTDSDAEFGGLEARKALEKRLLRKLDLRMSILIIIYILNYIDRNNASAARLRGFEKDLNLKGSEFATILSILYVGYILMQVPSNMFLNYIGKPSIYLPCCMIIWGVISILTGVTTNFVGALLTRFFLGFVEAAFFPGALFLISKWYKRSELSLRTAILFCGSLLSNAFGSLIASGILDGMEGKMGHAAWRWLFFIEGAMTVFVASCAIIILPDFPNTSSSWLTPAEAALAQRRMVEDAGVDETELKAGHATGLTMAVTDWKAWWLALALTSMVVSLSFNAFFPTLSATMGYNRTETLLLCAPPWIFASIIALGVSRHSDYTGERCWHIVIPLCVGVVGFVIAMSTMNTAARYVSLFLMAQSYAGFVCFLAWISNTMARPSSKRAVALALINAFSQLGNVAGSYIWPTAWGPTYRYSYAICISTSGLAIVMCFIFRQHLASLNEKAEKKEMEAGEERGYRYLL